jgi:hypothetical protein
MQERPGVSIALKTRNFSVLRAVGFARSAVCIQGSSTQGQGRWVRLLYCSCSKALEWRNWQTHGTQNPATFIGHVGSTPTSSTTDFGYFNDLLELTRIPVRGRPQNRLNKKLLVSARSPLRSRRKASSRVVARSGSPSPSLT